MADKKIFSEIQGIFGWIEHQNKKKQKGDGEPMKMDSKHQLQDFFKFLGVEDITEEEINALHELSMMKKEKHLKRDKHIDNKARDSADDMNTFTYKDLLRVFIPDAELTEKQIENDMEKEKKELINAFRILTPSKSGDTIQISRLKEMIYLYEKEYTGQQINKISRNDKGANNNKDLIMQKIDVILSDLKLEGNGNEEFNFKEYLEDQFNTRK